MRKLVRGVALVSAVLLASWLWPATASAQQTSGIAGVVKDASGAVLPGVTVEAASPALIEKVRTSVTDGQGQYKIVDLRPGTYTVTFTIAGFNVVKREGIELTTGFTAAVNADLKVGSLAETITVTGASPLVDTQNIRQQKVVSSDLLNSLPTSTVTFSNIGVITPGLAGTVNVGGAAGAYSMSSVNNVTFHGKGSGKTAFDGMRITDMDCASCTGPVVSPATVQEWTLETGGGVAESDAAGITVNYVPKDGSNSVKGSVSGLFTNDHLQSDNLTDELRGRGLSTVNKVHYIQGFDAAVGGPIKQDRLWYFIAARETRSENQLAGIFFNKTQGTPFYTPDATRPGYRNDSLYSGTLRLTWQASPKNKFNFFAEPQHNYVRRGEFAAPESMYWYQFWPLGIFQTTWSAVISNKLLFEAGAGAAITHWPGPRQPEVGPHDIAILEQSTGFLYNSNLNIGSPKDSDRYNQRFSVSYVTGSHAVKGGFQLQEGVHSLGVAVIDDRSYVFLNGAPRSVIEYATPYLKQERLKADLGLFIQDKWTVKRLTLNYGLRFDYYNASVPAQSEPAGSFVPARELAPLSDVPSWKDVSPRLGASFDLFGDGRTALKVSIGRYVVADAVVTAAAANPLATSVLSVARTWTDANLNYIPDCDLTTPAANGECGTIQDANFGKNNPRANSYADDALHGFGRRGYDWEFSAEVQHQLRQGVSVNGGYYRNWFGNFLATNNLAVTPADYSQYCITAPVDTRLPGGGGYPVCGLYDINPNKFGQVQSVVTQASNFGQQTLVNDFINLGINTRLGSGMQFGGGVDTGRSVSDNCFVVNSPQQLLYCHVVTPFSAQTQLKLFGSYPLPGDFVASATYQNTSGPQITASYTATNAQIAPSLGRNLASGVAGTATVPLIAPQTLFEGRRIQLDLRLSKRLKVGHGMRLEANVDLYNALNASSVSGINSAYGSQWLRPVGDPYSGGAILDGRLLEFGGRLSF